MHIRKATSADAQAVFDLRIEAIRQLCQGFYPDDLLMKWTDGTHPSAGFTEFVTRLVYVVEVGDKIAGCGGLDMANGKIDAIFVDPDHKNSGIGRTIMHFLERLAIDNQVKGPLHLEATLNAAPFYRKMGFVGDVLSPYHSPRGFVLDCIRMEKALPADKNKG